METAPAEILDLGHYAEHELERCLKDKMETRVLDEGGLYSPISISLVIPTRLEAEEGHKVERQALKNILSECSKLVDVGYLDEIVVMDATRDKNDNPDFRVLQSVTKVAYEELGLFKEQVDLLKKYGSENERAKRGLTEFFIKVVHQYDDNIAKVLAKLGVFGVTGIFGIPRGKGAGLWLSVPITTGDILCFVDSDILNFKKEFVTALCHPIVYSWNLREAAIKSVKAYYTRLTKTPSLPPEEAILGGRVSRLFASPLIRSVTKSLGLFDPLATIKYPLAGEFTLSRDTIEELAVPSAYSVEMYLLFQLFDLVGRTSMAQVDLQVYHHVGQTFSDVESIARQVGSCILERILEKRKKPLTEKEKQEILLLYQQNANQIIKESDELISTVKESPEFEGVEKLVFSKEQEEEHLQRFLKILESLLSEKREEKTVMLPSWSMIRERTGNYFVLRELLRRRSNQSTWSRLKECGLTGRRD